MSTEPAWPADIPLAEAPRRKLTGLLRWLWIPADHSVAPSQPELFQHARAAGDPPRVGICCSGGGLRSAAFSFGALDELWHAGIIEKADYLAGVSGGSYAVTAATIVRAQSPDAEWSKDQPGPYGLGSPELDYMRNRTDYLAPGLMGRWNMFLRLMLGIFFNLAVVLGLLYVVGRAGGRFYRWALPQLGSCTGQACTGSLTFHTWSSVVIYALLGIGLLAGILDLMFRPAAEWWWRRLVRWCGTFVFAAIIAAIVLRLVPQLLWWARTSRFGRPEGTTQAARAAGSVATAVVSLALSFGHLVFRSGAGGTNGLSKKLAKVPHRFRMVLQKVLIGLVVPLSLFVFFLIAIDSGTRPWTTTATWWWIGVLVAVLAIFAFGNPIAWSAQPFYKRRLRTVFALRREVNNGAVTVGPVPSDQEPALLRTSTAELAAAADLCSRQCVGPRLHATRPRCHQFRVLTRARRRTAGRLHLDEPIRAALDAHSLLPEGVEQVLQERSIDRSPPRCQPAVGSFDLGRRRLAIDGTHEQAGLPHAARDVEPASRRLAGQPAARQRTRRCRR